MKFAIFALAVAPALLLADSRGQTLQRISNAATVLQEIMTSPGKSVPQDIIERAQCVGIIPGVKKAAVVVGVKYGKGVMACRVGSGWSAPSTVIIEGGSIGAQVGAGEADVLLVVQNKSGEQKLMRDKFTLGTAAGVMAGPVGRTVQAATDAELHAEILSYALSRGLFAGIDLAGATLRPDKDDNRDLYGPSITQREILTGKAPSPPAAGNLHAELDRFAPNALTATR